MHTGSKKAALMVRKQQLPSIHPFISIHPAVTGLILWRHDHMSERIGIVALLHSIRLLSMVSVFMPRSCQTLSRSRLDDFWYLCRRTQLGALKMVNLRRCGCEHSWLHLAQIEATSLMLFKIGMCEEQSLTWWKQKVFCFSPCRSVQKKSYKELQVDLHGRVMHNWQRRSKIWEMSLPSTLIIRVNV